MVENTTLSCLANVEAINSATESTRTNTHTLHSLSIFLGLVMTVYFVAIVGVWARRRYIHGKGDRRERATVAHDPIVADLRVEDESSDEAEQEYLP